MKMYVVTAGEYSDAHVVGVFSSMELAEKASNLFAAQDPEEFELDVMPAHPPGMVLWSVHMARDGVAEMVSLTSAEDLDGSLDTWYWKPSKGWFSRRKARRKIPMCEFIMWASDEAHAVKIANERRAMLIAEGQFDMSEEEFRALPEGGLKKHVTVDTEVAL